MTEVEIVSPAAETGVVSPSRQIAAQAGHPTELLDLDVIVVPVSANVDDRSYLEIPEIEAEEPQAVGPVRLELVAGVVGVVGRNVREDAGPGREYFRLPVCVQELEVCLRVARITQVVLPVRVQIDAPRVG